MITPPDGPTHDAHHDRSWTPPTADLNAELDADFAPHFSDLERVRPFHWGVGVPRSVLRRATASRWTTPASRSIVGNPPWEIVKPDLREFYAQFDPDIESKLNRRQVEQRIEELQAEDPRRGPGWRRRPG